MIKKSLLLLSLLAAQVAQAQLPTFLAGTWQTASPNEYEVWEVAGDKMFGLIIQKNDQGDINIVEFMEIWNEKDTTFLSLKSPKRYNGAKFVLSKPAKSPNYSFSKPGSKVIRNVHYRKVNDYMVDVKIQSGEGDYSYVLHREKNTTSNNLSPAVESENPQFDPALAQQLNADQYGMKEYTLVILKTEPAQDIDSDTRSEALNSHFENINRMSKAGKLVVAGPVINPKDEHRGIYILKTNVQDAQKEMMQDKAVELGIFEAMYYRWYGSAALPMYQDFHEKIWQTPIN